MAAITREIAKASMRAPIIPAREAGEGHESALGREETAAGQFSGRPVVPDADQSGNPGLSEGAHGLLDRLLDLGEPEGLRRAAGGPVRPRDAGDHNGAPLLGERAPVRGFGGLPPCVRCSAAAREPGVRRGAQHPLARAQCTYTG